MLRTIAITLILAGASAAAQADVYRWVDEHGGVHYTDEWVPGSQLIKTTHPHSAQSSDTAGHTELRKISASADRASDQLAQENAQRAVQQDVAKSRQQQCKEAKERYEKVVEAHRIYKPVTPPPAGKDQDQPAEDRQFLSDDQADAFRLEVYKAMVEACGSAPK